MMNVIGKVVSVLSLNGIAVITSLQEDIEGWLRVAVLVASLAYTVILAVNAVRRKP